MAQAMRNSWDGWGWMVIDGDGDTLRFDSIHLISNKCHYGEIFTLTLMRRLRSMMRPRSNTSSKFPIKLFESGLYWQRRPWKFKLFKNHVNGEVLIANYCNTSTKWPNTSKCAPNQPSPAMDLRVLPLLWYQGAPPLWQFCGRWKWNREGERVASRRLFQASAFFTSSNLHWRTIFAILWSFLDLGSWHGYFWWYGVYGCGIMVGFEVPSSSHFYPFLQKVLLLPPVPCNVPGAEVSGVSGEICTTLRAWGLGKGGPLPGPGDSIPPWYACGCTVHPGIPVASILYIYSHPLVDSIYVSVSLL